MEAHLSLCFYVKIFHCDLQSDLLKTDVFNQCLVTIQFYIHLMLNMAGLRRIDSLYFAGAFTTFTI